MARLERILSALAVLASAGLLAVLLLDTRQGIAAAATKIGDSGSIAAAKCGMTCDGITDDRAVFAACVTTGGLACGKTLDMTGCLARLSGPGDGGTVASFCSGTTIAGDGTPSSGFTLDERICVGGTSPGAGCATSSDCSGVATCEGATFSAAGSTATLFGAVAGATDLRARDITIHANQTPQWGRCSNNQKGCRGYCDSGYFAGLSCDANADCAGGTTCSSGASGCCQGATICNDLEDANLCTTEGIWPAGGGAVDLFAWGSVPRVEISRLQVYDLAASRQAIAVGPNSTVRDVDLLKLGGPIQDAIPTLGGGFLDNTSYAVLGGVKADWGADLQFIRARGAAYGIQAEGGPGVGRPGFNSVRNSYVVDGGKSAIGVAIGPSGKVEDTYIALSGASATGIKAAANTSLTGNVILVSGGGTGGAGIVSDGSWIAQSYIIHSGGLPGIIVNKASSIANGTIVGSANTWADGIHVAANAAQTTVTGMYQSGSGYCIRGNVDSGGDSRTTINVTYSSNHCFAPVIACATITTGWIFADNYCAWLVGPHGTPLWIGDSGWHSTLQCGAGTHAGPGGANWSCCTGFQTGACDGLGSTQDPSSARAVGVASGHAIITGNLLHVSPLDGSTSASIIKIADSGGRCTWDGFPADRSGADCRGEAGAGARGDNCPCIATEDCAGTGATCQSTTGGLVAATGNILLANAASSIGIDAGLDDDDFGTASLGNRPATGRTAYGDILFSGNVIAAPTGISMSSANAERLTRFRFVGNLFDSAVAKFSGWRWTMGEKDDNPLATVFGGPTGSFSGGKAAELFPVSGLTAPNGDGGSRALRKSVEQAYPQATVVGGRCFVSVAPGASRSRQFWLQKSGVDDPVASCTISGAAATSCNIPSDTTIAFGERLNWREAAGSNGAAKGSGGCSLTLELTGQSWW